MIGTEAGCQLGHPLADCRTDCLPPRQASADRWTQVSRLTRLTMTCAVLVPTLWLVSALPGYGHQRRASRMLRWASRQVLAALDIRVRVRGTPVPGPSLIVANHTSWLDVLVLAAAADLVPVAKSEVAEWPLVGSLARTVGTVFVSRRRLRALPPTVELMTRLLRGGHRVQVFPEATTRCGRGLGRFHRAPFQAALDAAAMVQPAALRYRVAGAHSSAIAFVGDDTLLAALRWVVRLAAVEVDLSWLSPVPAMVRTKIARLDRRSVAGLSEYAVARELNEPVVPVRGTAEHRRAQLSTDEYR